MKTENAADCSALRGPAQLGSIGPPLHPLSILSQHFQSMWLDLLPPPSRGLELLLGPGPFPRPSLDPAAFAHRSLYPPHLSSLTSPWQQNAVYRVWFCSGVLPIEGKFFFTTVAKCLLSVGPVSQCLSSFLNVVFTHL